MGDKSELDKTVQEFVAAARGLAVKFADGVTHALECPCGGFVFFGSEGGLGECGGCDRKYIVNLRKDGGDGIVEWEIIGEDAPADEESNWYDFNRQAGVWDFTKTEDHIFAPYDNGGRRIGDMSPEELIQVIGVGYQEREELAKAVVELAYCEGTDASEEGIAEAVTLATLILTRQASRATRPNGLDRVIEEEWEEYMAGRLDK